MCALVIALSAVLSLVAPAQQKDSRTLRVEADVERELFMLPNYTVFDFLAFRVEPGGTIRLFRSRGPADAQERRRAPRQAG